MANPLILILLDNVKKVIVISIHITQGLKAGQFSVSPETEQLKLGKTTIYLYGIERHNIKLRFSKSSVITKAEYILATFHVFYICIYQIHFLNHASQNRLARVQPVTITITVRYISGK